MSWLFSQALVEAFSAATCSDGEPCAQLNVMPTQHKFWRNDKTMEPSQLSRFGLTCAVLTEDRGEELLMWYREGFRARTSAPLARALGSMAHGPASGEKWRGSWAKYDRNTSSWRTPQFSLLGGLEPFSGTWPRSGLMLDGECFPLPNAAPLTSANESGFWPTPCTPNGGRVNKASDIATKGSRPDGRKVQISLESAARSWATPLANDAEKRGDFDASNPRNGLAGMAKAWSTPRAADTTGAGRAPALQGGDNLRTQAKNWATPTTRDYRSEQCSPDYQDLRDAETRGKTLGWMAKSWSGSTEKPGSLSPEFLWLMGWPIGWTALEPLETAKYRSWLQQHGAC
jgi:hypothetical protein